MAMTSTLVAATALSALNGLLLLALVAVWLRNYRTFATPLTLGLVAFGAVLFVENAVAVAFFFGTGTLYSMDPLAQQAVLATRALQLVALGFLTYVTMQ